MRLPRLLAFMLLSACATSPASDSGSGPGVTKSGSALDNLDLRGPLLQFPTTPGQPSRRPNDQLAQDFLDLEFHLESGQSLPVLTRFSGPITLSMTGAVPSTARSDLLALTARLQTEVGLTLQLLPDNQPATLTLAFQPRSVLHRMEPTAACFVVPNVSSLSEYRAKRGSADLDWAQMRVRTRATLFLPSDTSPQEVRDCLHEETAQALGPVNDLYRLPDSVFNDDNFQSVLTGFDMLMLRLHYSPAFTSGMGEAEVAQILPGVLAAMNPNGNAPGPWSSADTPRDWLDAVARAVNPQTARPARMVAAQQALATAQQMGWQDNRLGFAYFILGRLQAPHNPAAAELSYRAAAQVYRTLPDNGVHLVHALMQLSAIALAQGQLDQAIKLADQAMPLASASQNAALLATLSLIKSEALDRQGHNAAAAALRLDSLPAARYGFGTQAEVRARAAEIAAIARLSPQG